MNPVEEEIERIREVRRRISAQCGDDPRHLVEYYRKFSAELKATGRYIIVDQPTRKPTEESVLREEPPTPPA